MLGLCDRSLFSMSLDTAAFSQVVAPFSDFSLKYPDTLTHSRRFSGSHWSSGLSGLPLLLSFVESDFLF